MKKFIKILGINILILPLLLLITEIAIWKIESIKLEKETNERQEIKFHKGINQHRLEPNFFPNTSLNYGRLPEGLEYKNKPIVLFGCSYAYGYNLEREETLQYKLAKMTKRPVYNQAFTGWGVQHMLYQTELDSFYEKISEPEYIIYTLIDDHTRRAYLMSFCAANFLHETLNLRYEEKDGQLVEIKNTAPFLRFIRRLYVTNELNQFFVKQYVSKEKNQEKCYDFIFKHMLQSKKNMEKKWKNTKYVILIYNTGKPKETRVLKQKLRKENFIVLDTHQLTKENLFERQYMQTNYHPTEAAWNLLTPLIVEKLEKNEKNN